MRKIKYRAWYEQGKNYVPAGSYIAPIWAGRSLEDGYIIEQFTGLRDKNDKEIYEGDIVKIYHVRLVSDGPIHKPRIADIKWLDDDCGFRLVGAEVRSTNPDIYPASHLEVIGNIHETSELLNGN